jgi:hypothetical protein
MIGECTTPKEYRKQQAISPLVTPARFCVPIPDSQHLEEIRNHPNAVIPLPSRSPFPLIDTPSWPSSSHLTQPTTASEEHQPVHFHVLLAACRLSSVDEVRRHSLRLHPQALFSHLLLAW